MTTTQQAQEVNELRTLAHAMNVCDRMDQCADLDALAELFFTPQGQEFCLSQNYPPIDYWRKIKEPMLKHNIYVDAGEIEVANSSQIAVIGNTTARLRYDDPTKRHEVIAMHRAVVDIQATDWAVVFVTSRNSIIAKNVTNNAIIL